MTAKVVGRLQGTGSQTAATLLIGRLLGKLNPQVFQLEFQFPGPARQQAQIANVHCPRNAESRP